MLGREEEEKWYSRLFGFKTKARKEYEKAVEWMEKALALQEELGVSDTVHTSSFQRNLANILPGLGEYDKALWYAQKSFEIRNAKLGKHPETVRILYLIGVIHEWRKDHKSALQSYEEAFVMEESLPEDKTTVRKLLCARLEETCKKLNELDKLAEYGSRTHLIMEIRSPASSPTEESLAFNYSNELQNDFACNELLISVSVRKLETILSAPCGLDGQELVCISYEVFKKVVASNKPIKMTLMSNGCNKQALSEVEFKGYKKVANSKVEENIEKKGILKMHIQIHLGSRCEDLVEREWKIKEEQLWKTEKELGINACEKFGLSLSFHSEDGLLFKEEHPISLAPTKCNDLGCGGRSTNPSCSINCFDDTCDLSAVLGILSSASIFSPAVQKLAKEVKNDIRNPWGHCNVQEWTDKKFTSCFDLMKRLVQALNLPAEDEEQTVDELGEWESKDMKLFMGGDVDADVLLNFIEMAKKQISEEVHKENAVQTTKALESIWKALEKYEEDILKNFESLKQRVECQGRDIMRHEKEIKALQFASKNK